MMPLPMTALNRCKCFCAVLAGLFCLLSVHPTKTQAGEECDFSGDWEAQGERAKYPLSMSRFTLKQVKPVAAPKSSIGSLRGNLKTYSLTFSSLAAIGIDGGVVAYGKVVSGVAYPTGFGTVLIYFKPTDCRELKGTLWTLRFGDGSLDKRFGSIIYRKGN